MIHHLNCATMHPFGGRLLSGEGSYLGAAKLVAHCLLVERPEGLVLVDTGVGLEDCRRPSRLGRFFLSVVRPELAEAETAVRQVEALGYDPADVRSIVMTHLDPDHAGGLADFPQAEVHVLRAEHQAAMRPSLREKARYRQDHWAHGPRWKVHGDEGESVLGFEAASVITDDVFLVPLAGHTRGHAGVAIRDTDASGADRWVLHCGDAYFFRDEMRRPPSCPPGLVAFQLLTAIDNRKRLANQERLRELANDAARSAAVDLFCAHDARELERAQA